MPLGAVVVIYANVAVPKEKNRMRRISTHIPLRSKPLGRKADKRKLRAEVLSSPETALICDDGLTKANAGLSASAAAKFVPASAIEA